MYIPSRPLKKVILFSGLTPEEEAAIRNAQRCERDELNKRKLEDADLIAARLLEARRKNVEQWVKRLY